jgi:DnaJ-class molecular chaperone
MIDDDESYDVCSACSGSGEGMWDGSRCYKCHGTGCEPIEQGDDDEFN